MVRSQNTNPKCICLSTSSIFVASVCFFGNFLGMLNDAQGLPTNMRKRGRSCIPKVSILHSSKCALHNKKCWAARHLQQNTKSTASKQLKRVKAGLWCYRDLRRPCFRRNGSCLSKATMWLENTEATARPQDCRIVTWISTQKRSLSEGARFPAA